MVQRICKHYFCLHNTCQFIICNQESSYDTYVEIGKIYSFDLPTLCVLLIHPQTQSYLQKSYMVAQDVTWNIET